MAREMGYKSLLCTVECEKVKDRKLNSFGGFVLELFGSLVRFEG